MYYIYNECPCKNWTIWAHNTPFGTVCVGCEYAASEIQAVLNHIKRKPFFADDELSATSNS